MTDRDDFFTPTENLLIDKVLTRMHQIPGYAPGVYRVTTLDGKWSREYYALCALRAKAIAILDRGDDGKQGVVAELVQPDENAVLVEALITDEHDRVMPGAS
jgi:hypothetical protein